MSPHADLIDADYQQWRLRFRRVVWVRGTCFVLAAAVAAVQIAGWLDFLARPRDIRLRWTITCFALAAVFATAWRVLIGPLRTIIDPARLSRLLEQLTRHPSGEHSLATQTQISAQDSPMLQAVTRSAAARISARPSHQTLRNDACLRAMLWCGLSLIIAAASVSLGAQESWTAVRRLTAPWAEFAWPQHDWLVLVDQEFEAVSEETIVDANQPLRLYVLDDRGSPPQEMWLQVRRGDSVESRKLDIESVRHTAGRVSRAGLIELASDEPFAIRVVGGDDRRMPWAHVTVYNPPRVTGFQIATTPPAYSGLGREQTESLSGPIECLIGSRIEVTATFDQPLTTATLIREGVPNVELELLDDGYQVTAAWTVTVAGHSKYQFEVIGEMIARNSMTRQCEVVAVSDEPPSIEVESPPASMLVTESASVPVRFTAEDDLAVDQVAAAYSLTMSADAESYALATDSQQITEQLMSATALLEPAALGAMVGDRISVWAEATDHFNLGPPHVSRSNVHTLSVVTEADKLSELNARLEALIAELGRLEAQASEAATSLAELQIQVQTAGELPPSDMEIVRKRLFDSQTAARETYESETSLLAQVTGLIDELQWNGLETTELGSQLAGVAGGLTQLRDWEFPSLLSDLTLVVTSQHDLEGSDDAELAASIVRASQSQRAIADVLLSMLNMLGEYRRFDSLGEAVARLRLDQESLNQNTLRTAESTLGRDWSELSVQQQADLQRLAERQSQVASTLSALVTESQRQATNFSSSNSVQTAVEIQRRLASPELLLWLAESSQYLDRNELGLAMPTQQAILTELTAMEDLLAGRESTVAATAVALDQSLATLTDSLNEQRALLQEIEQATGEASPQQQVEWADRQSQLFTQTERALIAQQARIREPWIQSGRRGAMRMREAHFAITQGDLATARTEQQEAVDDLSQSIGQLESLVAGQRQSQAFDEMQELPQHLQALIDSQTQLLAQVRDLDALHATAGQWSRDLLRGVREAAGRQQSLAEDAADVATSLSPWPTFQFAVDDALVLMHEAAAQLDARQVGAETQQLQEQIVLRLQQVHSSLSDAGAAMLLQPELSSDPRSPGEHDASARLSQVRLLRNLQEELSHQTEEVVLANSPSNDVMSSISGRQRELAELAEPLLSAFGGAEVAPLAEAATSALAAIEEVATSLEAGRFTIETVSLQADAVAALDSLLAAAPNSSTLASGETQSQQGNSPMPSEGEGQSTDTTAGTNGDGTGGDDSATGTAAEIEVQRARDRELAIDSWGHLPPRAQQELQADFSAEFLPEYDDWIRRYYEALAEER